MRKEKESNWITWIIGGGLAAALTASMCCLGPALFVVLGLGSFTTAGFFASLRPYLIGVAVLFLGVAWYRTFFWKTACAADGSCELRGSSKARKVGLVVVTVLMGGVIAYPQLSSIAVKVMDKARANNPAGIDAKAVVVPSVEASAFEPSRKADGKTEGAAAQADKTSVPAHKSAILEVNIASMTCPLCAAGIEGALTGNRGVREARVDFAGRSGRIVYDESMISADQLIAAIDASGFKAERRN